MKLREKEFKKYETLKIYAYKHDGFFHSSWEECIILEVNYDYIIGIIPQNTKVFERKKIWRTKEPAIIYFHREYWFNIIAMMTGKGVTYYCNLASPYVYENGSIKYIDYDLDIKVKRNLNFKVVDIEEFNHHKEAMNYPKILQEKVLFDLEILKSWINNKNGPFNPGYPYYWYGVYGRIKEI